MVKEEVIEETKVVNYEDVQIVDKTFSCVYIPKWVINNCKIVYIQGKSWQHLLQYLWMKLHIVQKSFLQGSSQAKSRLLLYVKDAAAPIVDI